MDPNVLNFIKGVSPSLTDAYFWASNPLKRSDGNFGYRVNTIGNDLYSARDSIRSSIKTNPPPSTMVIRVNEIIGDLDGLIRDQQIIIGQNLNLPASFALRIKSVISKLYGLAGISFYN